MSRRSSVWSEIARDRERRRRDAARAERVHRQVANQLEAEARRDRAAEERADKARQKQADAEERIRGLADAEEQTERLSLRVQELSGLLEECLTRGPFTVAEMVQPDLPDFDPGDDAQPHPAPQRPVLREGGLLGRWQRKREFEEAIAHYTAQRSRHQRQESERTSRLARRQAEHAEMTRNFKAAASGRATQLTAALRRGEEQAVEEFAVAAVGSLPMPEGIDLQPRVVYRPEPCELVVDLQLPDADVVPSEKSISYVHTRRRFTVKERPHTELGQLYLRTIAQLPLAVLRALFGAFDPGLLESVTVNGLRPAVDPATGRPHVLYQVSVTTSRSTFDGLVLDATDLDPVKCLHYLGAKLAQHPLDLDEVKPFLTFELAKYRLADSIDVVASLDSRTDLSQIEWGAFEQLVRQLLQAMNGGDARVTRRSRDDGIDGVLFDCNAVMGGEYVVQAKRHRKVVPANDVRALAGVMHDKRANHAVFVTPSWFSDDGRRFAADNRIRLIEGPELKQLLHEYLDLEVLVPKRGTPPMR